MFDIHEYIKNAFPEVTHWYSGLNHIWLLKVPGDSWEIFKIDVMNPYIFWSSSDFIVNDTKIDLAENNWYNCPYFDYRKPENVKKICKIIKRLRSKYKKWQMNCKLKDIDLDFE